MTDIEALVQERFGLDKGWLTLQEVSEAPGWDRRRIDLLSIGVWGSNRLHTKAFEVKRSKADFAKELSQPQKREAFASQVNEFWFVAPPDVIPVSEVPEECGLLHVTKGGLRRKKNAKQRKQKPDALLLLAIIKASIRRFDAVERQHSFYATFRGKEVSFETLCDWCSSTQEHLRSAALRDLEEHRRKRAENRQRSNDWHVVMGELEALGRSLAGLASRRYRASDPDELPSMIEAVRAGIRAVGDVQHLPRLAADLRKMADCIEGKGGSGAN